MRQRMEVHRANPACASCHKMMDPIGFALENFDGSALGAPKRTAKKWTLRAGIFDGTKINGVVDLRKCANALLTAIRSRLHGEADDLRAGRGVDYDDMPVVRSIVREGERKDYKFSSLVLGIIKSQPFQMNRKPDGAVAAASR